MAKNSTKAPQTSQKVKSNKLELLVTVINRDKAEFYADLLQSFEVNMQLIVRAEGTANQAMLNLLGLEEKAKAVIFSIIKEERLPEAIDTLEEKFNTIKNGKGIAYSVPMTSIIGVAIYGFLSNNTKTLKEEETK